MNRESPNSAEGYFIKDDNFDGQYPYSMRMAARRHWTPVRIAKLASEFLCRDGGKILDIGSGIGKFCLTGGWYHPETSFYGVEQRAHLVRHARRVQRKLDLENVSFINRNFTELNLAEYDHFYFYNSFFENIDNIDKIDSKIDYSEERYVYYVQYLKNALSKLRKGTKVVTYHSLKDEIPLGYCLLEKLEGGDLNFWQKQ